MITHKLLNNINESYFFDYKNSSKLDEFNESKKKLLNRVYEENLNIRGQYGFSKSEQCEYIKMFKILYYDRGGHIILPTYILGSENKKTFEKDNGDFQSLTEDYTFQCIQ